jgi:uncharacterized protein
MSSSVGIAEVGTIATRPLAIEENRVTSVGIETLTNKDEREVEAFLSLRPIHTVYMAGLIRDNGLISPLNRGRFYAYRNLKGKLEGVAFVGPKMVFEAHTGTALEAFAGLALDNPPQQLIRGEKEQTERLVDYLRQRGRAPRRVCRELLLEQHSPADGVEPGQNLRPAIIEEQEQVASINALMIFEENGVNPLERDLEGVLQRIRRRIEQRRVWVLVERGRIIFKAEVISETPDAAFIEGVYVHPAERGRGYGFRCLTELGRILLARTSSLCLVVNEENKGAQALYTKAGYELRSHYRTVYF